MVLYTSLMTVCHKGGQPGRAMDIFRTMECEGLQADVVRTLDMMRTLLALPVILSCKSSNASQMKAHDVQGHL